MQKNGTWDTLIERGCHQTFFFSISKFLDALAIVPFLKCTLPQLQKHYGKHTCKKSTNVSALTRSMTGRKGLPSTHATITLQFHLKRSLSCWLTHFLSSFFQSSAWSTLPLGHMCVVLVSLVLLRAITKWMIGGLLTRKLQSLYCNSCTRDSIMYCYTVVFDGSAFFRAMAGARDACTTGIPKTADSLLPTY